MLRRILKDLRINGPYYFATSSFGGGGCVTKHFFSLSGQCRADYIVDLTVGIVLGHPQIYDPD
jgi:hypothetical protein